MRTTIGLRRRRGPAALWRCFRATGLAVLGVMTAGLAGGCSDAKINDFVVKIFEPKRSAQQYMLVAFASEDADERRDALARVARSKERDREWAIKGYVAVALLDTDPQARCVALRALARTGEPRAAETALKLLNHREYPPREVRPPGPLCRWDAAVALAELSTAGNIPAEHLEKVPTTLTECLRSDTERHARAAAARGLGYYPTEAAVRALISGLNDEDFAIVHECEESLVRLTGRTHNCDALAWEDWLEANRAEPFAHAGEIPAGRRLPYRNRLEKVGYDLQQFGRWLVPGRKE